jgi:hypothetical protein
MSSNKDAVACGLAISKKSVVNGTWFASIVIWCETAISLLLCGGCTSGGGLDPVQAGADWTSSGTERAGQVCLVEEWERPTELQFVQLDRRMSCPLQNLLIRSLNSAVRALQREPRCHTMFTELGRNGIEVLSRTIFILANPRAEAGVCRGAEAFTLVGGRWTGLCRSFVRLSEEEAATIILHEALHHAGLGEHPADRRGMTSLEITSMVRRRCGLSSER